MSSAVFVFILVLSFIFFFVTYYMIRLVTGLHKKKQEEKQQTSTQVGFVVDTFHVLVSKLKEKEKELEALTKIAEERASSIEVYNENILQSVPSGVISFDSGLMITKMNAAAMSILDLREQETIGKRYSEVFDEAIAGMIAQGDTVERAEFGYSLKNGKRIWLGLNISPLKDRFANKIGWIMILTDLTELKAFQSRTEQRERLLNLGEMSAGIAHELRNPLGVISGYTKILSRKADQTQLPAVNAIAKEVTVMDRIITDFLSFAKDTDLVLTRVDLKELVEGCINAMPLRKESIRVSFSAEALPMVKADEVLMRQAVSNLLLNALESMPEEGELTVNGWIDDTINIAVSDTGYGIPEAIKEKIFLPFFTTKERGTGLGLSIVHKIVLSHGGNIKIESGEKGSIFVISLPLEMMAGGSAASGTLV